LGPGRTLVDHAADGNVEKMREELTGFADPNSEREGLSALHAAVNSEVPEALELLLLDFKATLRPQEADQLLRKAFERSVDAEADLTAANQLLSRHTFAALDSLKINDLQECTTMQKPPLGVDDVFVAVMVLLAGGETPTGMTIPIQKATGKIPEENRCWAKAKQLLLGDIPQLVSDLKAFKDEIDAGRVPRINWKQVRPYLAMEHFKVL